MLEQRATRQEREQAKRDVILAKALDVFSHNGYIGTTTDMLAAEAAVSKQTLYRLFGNKDGVFSALIHTACDEIVDPFAALMGQMRAASTATFAVGCLAEHFSGSIMQPRIQKLRRLVIAEATRFPDLAELYWQAGFGRTIDSLAECLSILDRRGLLRIENVGLAAHHLAGLLLWFPSNRAMFSISAPPVSDEEFNRHISAGVRAFTRAYAPSPAEGVREQ